MDEGLSFGLGSCGRWPYLIYLYRYRRKQLGNHPWINIHIEAEVWMGSRPLRIESYRSKRSTPPGESSIHIEAGISLGIYLQTTDSTRTFEVSLPSLVLSFTSFRASSFPEWVWGFCTKCPKKWVENGYLLGGLGLLIGKLHWIPRLPLEFPPLLSPCHFGRLWPCWCFCNFLFLFNYYWINSW